MRWHGRYVLGRSLQVWGAHQQGRLLDTNGWEPGMAVREGWAFYILNGQDRFGPFTVTKATEADKDGMASLQISPELKDFTANGALIFDAEE